MLAVSDTTIARDIRFPVVYGDHDVEAIAGEMGVTLSDVETAVILDHIDREINKLARAAAAGALRTRIMDLVRVVRSAHVGSTCRPARRRRTWITG